VPNAPALPIRPSSAGGDETGDPRWRVGGFETALAASLDGVKTGRQRRVGSANREESG
jgi:hypothetical protein